TDAGTYRLRATFAGDDNHLGSQDAQTMTIAPASSTTAVSCPAGPYTYTGAAQMPCSAMVTGASLNLTPTPSYADNIDAGTATARASFTGDANHTGSSATASFTIGQAILTVTADNKTMVLSGPLPVLTGTLTGVKNGDGITASYSTSANGTSVGVFPIVPSLYDPNAKLGNYTVATTNGNLTVQYAQGGICLASPGHQILQPVNADGSSVFKQGSKIPV